MDTGLLTQDEESSGIISLEHILGEGYYLADVQAHFAINTGTPRGFENPNELVEGGQLLVINTNVVSAELVNGVLTVQGTVNDDEISVEKSGKSITVKVNGEPVGSFRKNLVTSVELNGGFGDDLLDVGNIGNINSIVHGNEGSDVIIASQGSNQLHGEEGHDFIYGGNGSDLIFGGDCNDFLVGGKGADAIYGEAGDGWLFDGDGADLLDGGLDFDWLLGGNGSDSLKNGERNYQ